MWFHTCLIIETWTKAAWSFNYFVTYTYLLYKEEHFWEKNNVRINWAYSKYFILICKNLILCIRLNKAINFSSFYSNSRIILVHFNKHKMGCFNDPAWTTTTQRVCVWLGGVADTNYLYPASWGWIKNTIKNKLWFANSPKCSLRQDNLIYIYIS